MLKIKLKNNKTIIILAAYVLILAIALGITLSFFNDKQKAENVFTLGDVQLSLVEQNYPKSSESRVMYSKSIIPKDPMIINTGNNDEYVFMAVTVPLEEVTLLDDDGQKQNDTPTKSEIFNLLSTADSTQTSDNITYNSNWIFLSKTENIDTNTYIFAYNKVLLASRNSDSDAEIRTSTLFDKVQLKSFIEGEIAEKTTENIVVKAYGIQADELIGVELPTDTDTQSTLKSKLIKIFNIYARQNDISIINE